MSVLHRLETFAIRPHLPRRTVRLRLTALYGVLFLLSGLALLAITYVLVQRATESDVAFIRLPNGATIGASVSGDNPPEGMPPEDMQYEVSRTGEPPPEDRISAEDVLTVASQQHADTMRQLLIQSGIALSVMAVASVWLGWVIAGRVLNPLRTITAAARDISATNLHERLAVSGPNDEIKELGDTIDGLLERLDASFRAQRQFVANASHELRTPLARQRTLMQVALTDPDASVDSLRTAIERALVSGSQEEQLIEALLTLTRGQTGLDRRESFDLAAVVEEVLLAREQDAARRGLQVRFSLAPAPVSGNRRLAERLIANLVDNALRYNVPSGFVDVLTGTEADRRIFSIVNSGPVVPESEIDRLLRPFQRMGLERSHQQDGLGLGLSIVQAIANAHSASLTVLPRENGGLQVEVHFNASRLNARGTSGFTDRLVHVPPGASNPRTAIT